MTRLLGRLKSLRRPAAVLVMVGGLVAALASPAAASTHQSQLSAKVVVLGCAPSGGGDVDIRLANSTQVEKPVVISVYRAGDLVFEGDEFAPPGKSVLPYRGLPPATYWLVVRRQAGGVLDLAKADFRRCPDLPDPPLPLTQQLMQTKLSQQ